MKFALNECGGLVGELQETDSANVPLLLFDASLDNNKQNWNEFVSQNQTDCEKFSAVNLFTYNCFTKAVSQSVLSNFSKLLFAQLCGDDDCSKAICCLLTGAKMLTGLASENQCNSFDEQNPSPELLRTEFACHFKQWSDNNKVEFFIHLLTEISGIEWENKFPFIFYEDNRMNDK
ncbi:hypothetical protein T4D_2304 [Trichinella pseudospiralis]|uniref:Uncharacterized protein n=1 Tax=Trichinella pseudospiralis TaxID=6337 RepID=A0A0V1FZU4_TRIPS|nr:hypothetical protein T4D_2304 [Trichinella pseudospiralis]